ncbi:MAG: tyrosine-type recombinase/integrase [Alphaproteobacteria bacterium]
MATKITKRTVDAAKVGAKDTFLWDSEIKGFGLKVTPKGRKVYVLQYRFQGSLRRYTIGAHGSPWTADKARDEALRLLNLAKDGTDPATARQSEKDAITLSALCDLYLVDGVNGKSPSTLATDKGRIERHIKPLLGRKRVKDLDANDIKKFMRDVASGKTATDIKTGKHGRARVTGGEGTANRTVGLLGGILSFAIDGGIRSDNPVHGVKRYAEKRSERFLSPQELARLGDALALAERTGENQVAINGIRLLILTGCRKSEILALQWEYVNFETEYLELPTSKTGQKRVPIGAPALDLLASMPRINGNPYVLPGEKEGKHLIGLPRVWRRIRIAAGLDNVRLHDLRHSFASVGAGAGMGLAVVGKVLGHRNPSTTARYAHIADDPAKVAANRISQSISELMNVKSHKTQLEVVANEKA